MLIDLHIHSEHSVDGEFSVQKLVEQCKSKEISVMAVADHNSVFGIEEALYWGGEYGVEIVPAIEIDTSFQERVFHLLGYYIDYKDKEYQILKDSIQDVQMYAFPLMIKNLNEVGFEITWEDMLSRLDENSIPSEELVADMIMANPLNRDNELIKPYLPGGTRSAMPSFYFYLDYLAPGTVGFAPRDFIGLKEAAALIKKTGGVPILAHPGGSISGDFKMLDDLLTTGLEGLEVFSSYHTPEDTKKFLQICAERDYLLTCGSDFHGRMKTAIQLGEHKCTEDQSEILRKLKAASEV